MHDDDNALMEKVKSGVKDAYETLVIKHRSAAINFADSFISDLYEAEDIVQECFAKIYITRMEYKPSHTFKTYLFAVIRNRCIDYLRQKKKSGTVNLDNLSEISCNAVVEDLFFENEQQDKIFNQLNNLTNDYRTAIYLFAIDGMSYDQIAKVMRKSIPQVKITIYRARKKLKILCEGVDVFEK